MKEANIASMKHLGGGVVWPLRDKAFSSCAEPNALITVMYFSYNCTRDWLKIKWRDQSCMQVEVVAKINKKNSVTFRSSLLAFDLREYRDCLSEFL